MLCVFSLYGCKSVFVVDSQPAVIPQHTTESIAEIRSIVNQAFNDTQVIIAKTAFSKNNRLLLVRKKQFGPDGRVIQTRVDEEPIILELHIKGDNCYLSFLKTNKQYQLKHASCDKFNPIK
jgi:hypothetical protein